MNPARSHEPPSAAQIAEALREEFKRQGLNRRRISVKLDRSGSANTVLVELRPDMAKRIDVITDIARRFEHRNPPGDPIFPQREVFVKVRLAPTVPATSC